MNTLHRESLVIRVEETAPQTLQQHSNYNVVSPNLTNFSTMKLFNRFRKLLMRLIFSLPSRGSSSAAQGMTPRHRNCDRFEPPKTSCSSFYSSHSHYNEAIADCIEFFNKSSQEGILEGRKSDVLV
ncbi:hypothetical protein TIFTF001_005507 [Ficus carica]|uniref:Uncharacterized protein n=1 Tax=Ficus carica TaxID=3494 RepID=A0AA87ZYE0_FICCA|nr:hypothetical protein TIFTF001_005507 [Ficus carica]